MKNYVLLILILLIVGCSDRSTDPEPQNSSMIFYGTYFAADDSANIALQKTDSVELFILNGRSYSLTFLNESGGQSDFCDHAGELSGFYTNIVRFIPTDFFESNCDNFRVPAGEFQADYMTHGDTIYISYVRGDTLKRLKLVE